MFVKNTFKRVKRLVNNISICPSKNFPQFGGGGGNRKDDDNGSGGNWGAGTGADAGDDEGWD